MRSFALIGLATLFVGCGGTPEPVRIDDEAAQRPRASPEQLAEISRRLVVDREIADAFVAGTLGDRALRERLLLVDARPAAGVRKVQYMLVPGEIPAPRRAALFNLRRAEVDGKRWMLQGGEDVARAAVFGSVEPGVYTVCAQVGPVGGPPQPRWRDFPIRCVVHTVTDSAEGRVVVLGAP